MANIQLKDGINRIAQWCKLRVEAIKLKLSRVEAIEIEQSGGGVIQVGNIGNANADERTLINSKRSKELFTLKTNKVDITATWNTRVWTDNDLFKKVIITINNQRYSGEINIFENKYIVVIESYFDNAGQVANFYELNLSLKKYFFNAIDVESSGTIIVQEDNTSQILKVEIFE